MSFTNEFGQPIGEPVPVWKPCPLPEPVTLTGRTCRLEQLDASKHADDLFAAFSQDDGRLWTYMLSGPFTNANEYREYAEKASKSSDPRYYAIIDLNTEKAVGTLALMPTNPMHGVFEVRAVMISPLLKQSTQSTEAQFLLMAYAFDELDCRRYEWKCNSLNTASRKAAVRLGFTFEGIFQKHMIIKGHSRDTAWFAITNDKWPKIKAAFRAWLATNNFNEHGQQIKRLEDFRKSTDFFNTN